jgi:mono/diheme cytochrome c family protein
VPSLSFATSVLFVLIGSACPGVGWSRTAAAAGQTGVFTAAQSAAGRTAYRTHCAGCHASDLGGRDDAPALTGPDFLKTWGPRTTAQLHDFIRTTMPPDDTTLTPDEYLAVVSHLLERNGAVAGDQPFAATTAVGIASIVVGRP